MTPKLSICIPTCDRARFLERLLTHLERDCIFSFATEVVVSDNASTDNTPEVIERFRSRLPRCRFMRQPRRVAGVLNARTVMRAARGEYLLYVADDDFLLPSAIPPLVEMLDAEPKLTAVFAPWEMYDLSTNTSLGHFYRHAQPRLFALPNALDALEFILDGHVFPEIGIYRTEALVLALVPSHFTYWAFSNLIRLLARGMVLFHPHPFYRSVVRQEKGQQLDQFGHSQARSDWDIYRGGLQYYLHHAVRLSGTLPASDRIQELRKKIDHFIDRRIEVAMRLWADAGDASRAYELLVRLRATETIPADREAAWTARLRMRAAVQTAIACLSEIPAERGVRLVLAGVNEPAAFRQLVAEVKNPPLVEEFDPANGRPLAEPDKCICIRGHSVPAKDLVAHGIPPGRIISESDLLLACL